MKKIILFNIACFSVFSLFAQSIEISPKISFGTQKISSGNLTKSFNQRNALDPDIQKWDANQKLGFAYSIGVSFQYNINDNLSLVTEFSFYSAQQKDKIDYFKNNLNSSGDGSKKTITSELKIKTTSFNLPIMVQYSIGKNNDIRFGGGLEFLFVGKPSLSSYETKTKESYQNNVLKQTQTDVAQINSTANVFSSVHTNLILSLGKTFNINDKNFYIDLRYHLPLSKSMLYTTDINYDNVVMKNNEVFDVWGKVDAEQDAPSFPLNDFKLSIIEISFRYVLFKN